MKFKNADPSDSKVNKKWHKFISIIIPKVRPQVTT